MSGRAGVGDPILTGFDGVKFEFQGQKNKFYNLISAPEHLVRFLYISVAGGDAQYLLFEAT